MRPQPTGEPWGYGAVSTARWTGVALREVLLASQFAPSAREVLIEGADGGYVADADRTLSFGRSLPLAQALHPDTLLAYAMNGEALTVEHGFPVRLIVPGWYGMASVKWVTRIEALPQAFGGYYQSERYVLVADAAAETAGVPLTTTAIRSVISEPAADTRLARGEHVVRGYAWSGAGPITRVEVSADGGATWVAARLTSPAERYAWRRWVWRWQATTPGSVTLLCRAYDALGSGQPSEALWNHLGYANNAVQAVRVHIE
jgi:DMSO/TMAO reductase YedYZ molybdopterin-dependent catalytic subunit